MSLEGIAGHVLAELAQLSTQAASSQGVPPADLRHPARLRVGRSASGLRGAADFERQGRGIVGLLMANRPKRSHSRTAAPWIIHCPACSARSSSRAVKRLQARQQHQGQRASKR